MVLFHFLLPILVLIFDICKFYIYLKSLRSNLEYVEGEFFSELILEVDTLFEIMNIYSLDSAGVCLFNSFNIFFINNFKTSAKTNYVFLYIYTSPVTQKKDCMILVFE